MARPARNLVGVVVALLIVEAIKSVPMTTLHHPPRECGIAASVTGVPMPVVPATRASTSAAARVLRGSLGALTIAVCESPTSAMRPTKADPTTGAWFRILRQRARAPNDPDPI